MKKLLSGILILVLAFSAVSGLAESKTEENVFETLSRMEWSFSSGVGAWSTDLWIQPDGTFSGSYHDSEMGDTGEGYPDGTVYVCAFTGKLSEAERIDEKTWKIRVDELQANEEPGQETIESNVRYITAEVYGLSQGDVMDLYAPGTPVAVLSEDMQMWAHVLDQVDPPVELDTWFLSSISNDSGFVGYEVPGGLAMPNPWESMTAEQLLEKTGYSFVVPEGAQNVTYSYLPDEDMAQMQFTWDGTEFCARVQSADIRDGKLKDISGMYYQWENEEPVKVHHCDGILYQAEDEVAGQVQLCLWYDLAPGFMYSLSATGPDLNGLDLVAMAEGIFPPMQEDA